MGSGYNSVGHGGLFSNKYRHRPFARRVAFLYGQDFFFPDGADIIGLWKAGIRKAVPLHGFGKHGKAEVQRLVIHVANHVNEVVVSSDGFSMATA